MALRDEQRELTRHKVLGAVLELVADGTLDEVSVPAVSKRSGVSVATIYRYFPSKDDLLAEAAAEPSRRALASTDPTASDGDDQEVDEFAAFQRAMWTSFAENLPLLRHQISSEAGREMRRSRLVGGRERLATHLEAEGLDPQTPEGQRLISLILLVSGSVALVELHDRQGLEVNDALDASLWATHALIDATRRGGGARDSERGRP